MNDTSLDYVVRMNDKGVLTCYQQVPVKTVTLAALARHVMETRGDRPLCTPLLPSGEGACRVYAETGASVGFLMQCNPLIRTLRYVVRNEAVSYDYTVDDTYNDASGNTAYMFKVSMPWMWVLCKFFKKENNVCQWRRCFLCATYRNLERMGDRVYVAPLPNQWGSSGLMCTGDIINESLETDKPGLECRKFLFRLFDSYFNDDLKPAMPQLIRRSGLIHTLGEWERQTKDSPGIGLNTDLGMVPYGTLEDFMNNGMGGAHDDDRG